MEVVFILADSQNPKNIGAAARAMKSMGHSDLRLVRCAPHLGGESKALAVGSYELVEQAKCFDSVAEAIEDIDLLIATTMRHRRRKSIYCSIEDLSDLILQKGSAVKKVGVLFGGERSGLKTEDVELCDVISTIPTAGPHPAVNLSQAVMVYSYELATKVTIQTEDWRKDPKEVTEAEYRSLRSSALDLLDRVGFTSDDSVRRHVLQALGRLNYDDLYLVQKIRKRVAETIASLSEPHDDA